MAHKNIKCKLFSIGDFAKNLFRKPETPLPDNENVDLLVNKTISEIDNIIRDYVFGLTRAPALIEIYFVFVTQTLLIITHEKPLCERNDRTTEKYFSVTTTRNLTPTREKWEKYLEKLWLTLQTANFTICTPFGRLAHSYDLCTFITYTNLCEMEDHYPDMMMFSDF